MPVHVTVQVAVDVHRLAHVLVQYGVTHLTAVPHLWQALVDHLAGLESGVHCLMHAHRRNYINRLHLDADLPHVLCRQHPTSMPCNR